jgi:hypothetical protein
MKNAMLILWNLSSSGERLCKLSFFGKGPFSSDSVKSFSLIVSWFLLDSSTGCWRRPSFDILYSFS